MTSLPTGFKVALLASDEDVRLAAADVLKACSYEVFPVASVDDCLQLFTIRRIDIVLAETTDLNVDSIKTGQMMTVLKSVPLILMSDSESAGALFHGLKIGAVDFLKRPLDESKVRSMWQHTLHKRLTSSGVALDEGPSNYQRRVAGEDPGAADCPQEAVDLVSRLAPPVVPRQTSTPSEGSSNEPKNLNRSNVDSTRRTNQKSMDPVLTQEVTSRPTTGIQDPPFSILPSHLTSHRSQVRSPPQDPQKRSSSSPGDQSGRRIRPNLMNRDSTTPPNASMSMTIPPLLGIPPGCVPPIGTNGLAIGMPFLNQHPFAPANPAVNMNSSLGFSMPYLFAGGGLNRQEMSVAPQIPDVTSLAPFPMFPSRSSGLTGMVPTNLASPLPRVGSTPGTFSNIEVSPDRDPVVPSQEEQSSSGPAANHEAEIPLNKSPSLINF